MAVDTETAHQGGSRRSPWVLLEGEPYPLVAYGDERDDEGRDYFSTPCSACGTPPRRLHADGCPLGAGHRYERPARCRDCACRIGEIHRLNCGIEQCPRCGGQYSSCSCDGSEDEDPWPGDLDSSLPPTEP